MCSYSWSNHILFDTNSQINWDYNQMYNHWKCRKNDVSLKKTDSQFEVPGQRGDKNTFDAPSAQQ